MDDGALICCMRSFGPISSTHPHPPKGTPFLHTTTQFQPPPIARLLTPSCTWHWTSDPHNTHVCVCVFVVQALCGSLANRNVRVVDRGASNTIDCVIVVIIRETRKEIVYAQGNTGFGGNSIGPGHQQHAEVRSHHMICWNAEIPSNKNFIYSTAYLLISWCKYFQTNMKRIRDARFAGLAFNPWNIPNVNIQTSCNNASNYGFCLDEETCECFDICFSRFSALGSEIMPSQIYL